MAFDLIIRNGTLVLPEGVRRSDIAIAEESVVQIGEDIAGTTHAEIDASGLHVMPGAIDPHVHFNEPGRSDWEGIATGSLACAAGGTTCFFEMPLNASPPTLDRESFDLKLAAMKAKSRVDFALWGGLTPGNLDHLETLAERGVIGFKAFMSNSGIEDFSSIDDEHLRAGMKRAAALELPVAVHAESEAMTSALTAEARNAGRSSVRDYLDSRPIEAEVEAIRRACELAGETRCTLHIVHVSSAAGVHEVLAARERGVDVTCETCPHYLLLTDEDVQRLGAVAKCAPPIRNRTEVEKLWTELLAVHIDFIASDHSPAPMSMKMADDFFAVWGGIAGCQSLLSALLSESRISMQRLAELTSRNAARRFHIDRKGEIGVGLDADLVIVEPETKSPLRVEDLHYRHRLSPYVGRPLHGMVRRTIVRGQTVAENNRSVSQITPRFVRPVV